MTERPILFSGPMVQALLSGRKTQTRRLIKPQPLCNGRQPLVSFNQGRAEYSFGPADRNAQGLRWRRCPHGQPGDRLWVKETWRPRGSLHPWDLDVTYAADGAVRTIKDGDFGERDWTMPKAAATGNVSPLFMPRWASRLTLEITDVRPERLNDIRDEDAEAEGIRDPSLGDTVWAGFMGIARDRCPSKTAFALLWMVLHGSDSWRVNPWVWAITFRLMP